MVDVKVKNGLELDTPPDSIHNLCPSSPDSSKAEKVLVLDEKVVWSKVDRRLLPILAVMYLFSFMDRANIGNARLQGLEKQLNMTGNQYNMALTLFFIVLWGLIVFHELLVARLFLGVAEAGFFPGVVYYLSMWYPRYMYQMRVAYFFGAASMAGAFSGLLAYGIGYMDGMRGLQGWSWIFIIEGTATVLAGIVAGIVMVDFPSTSKFLTPEEKQFILDAQRKYQSSLGEEEHFEPRHFWEAVTDWQVYCFVLISLGFVTPSITIYLFAYLSDKLRLRAPFLFASLAISFVGYAINVTNAPAGVKYFGIFLCVTGSYAGIPGLSAWQGNNTSGQYKRGIALGLHIGMANFGGAIGGSIFRKRDSPQFILGFGLELMFILLGMIAIVITVLTYKHINSRRDEIQRGEVGVHLGDDVLAERRKMGDRAVDFRYTL
ncbi:hypothetical protein EST38_g9540 [Candolleomyces aberdarensis]|uniref:Major facilitator superfamily (MFS) profile domain-containing protein n=1 Tax=Candolleomyces aberdarensis TaxID=2316362 RepID=A0A4Q2D9Q9_9AGAR|nr:hypothetical protein EST38_g9540 [Candolleomyces aberdarensis]